MAHNEFRREAIRTHGEKLNRLVGRAVGGSATGDRAQDERMIKRAFGEHDAQLHGGKHTKLKFADGGGVDDADRGAVRRDRRARGGSAGGKRGGKGTHVAVIVAPQGGGGPGPGLPIAPPGGLAAPPPRPPVPVGPPPGGPPVMPPGGGAPG